MLTWEQDTLLYGPCVRSAMRVTYVNLACEGNIGISVT